MSNSSNPVVKALASAQQEMWNQNETAIERVVLEALHPVFSLPHSRTRTVLSL